MRPASLGLIALALLLSGCDTTQDKSQRAAVSADRALDSRKPVNVARPDPRFKIETVQAVGRGKTAAIVVRFKSSAAQATADLPISVGIERDGARKLLNRGPNVYYFQNHIPAAPPLASTVWVVQLGKRIPRGKLFAAIGTPRGLQTTGATPDLAIAKVRGSQSVTGLITNRSGLPQYVVELYATASHHGKYVAAGRSRVVKLTGDGTQRFAIPLAGRRGRAKPVVAAGAGILVKP